MRLRVARVVLNLGVDPSYVLETELDNKWKAHKMALLSTFSNSPPAYRKRILSLAATAADNRADLIVFPACALCTDQSNRLEEYITDIDSFNWVFSGTYNQIESGKWEEGAIAVRKGGIVERYPCDEVHWFGDSSFSIMNAVSSTIGDARKSKYRIRSPGFPPNEKFPVLLLDMGHHQYTGRYILTLRSVANRVSKELGVPSGLFLAYWKYRNTVPRSFWHTSRGCNMTITRYTVSVPGTCIDDLLDIAEVEFGGGESQ